MTVYIIPCKTKRIADTLDSICDEAKIARSFKETDSNLEENSVSSPPMTYEEFCESSIEGVNRSLYYASNERRIIGYVSGYLCHPDLAEEQFAITKEINLRRIGNTLADDTGNYFYHIIQSFPEGVEISYDEAHRCGVELVQRLELHQAVIATHFYSIVDEYGDLRGRQKQNHIIMNSHIYHKFVDEDTLDKMKYHNCKKSYAELQFINDQIAIEHGFPIISNSVVNYS